MAGYFEEDEPMREESSRNTELTLSTGALVAIPIGLIVLCGLCFGLGYAAGSRGTKPATAATTPASAPDQEPLQGSGSIPKPPATAQAPVAQPAPASASAHPSAPGGGESPEAVAPSMGVSPQNTAPQTGTPASAPPPGQVRPALPGSAPAGTPTAALPFVRPAMPATNSFMVQIAAVKSAEDANVLVNALRNRSYPVIARREPADGLIHVRIGPFPTRDEARHWQTRLLDDGYNAIVEP